MTPNREGRGYGVQTLAALLAATLGVAGAWAQQPATDQQTTDQQTTEQQTAEKEKKAEPTPPTVLGEITVTAQKRAENIQLVPLSVSTLNTDQIQLLTAGAGDVLSLSGRVPSLLLETSFGRAFPRFYIRGLGNTDFDLNASQPVSMVVDDIVLENPILKGMPLWDIDHVEVLRGPQGTLFGRNTPAGVVKFDTVRPSRDTSGYASLSYGTYGIREVQAAVGGALSETFTARASLLYQGEDNWIDNKHTGQNDVLGGFDMKAYRLQMDWKPNDSFNALLNAHGWQLDGTARIFRANILKPGTNDLVAGFNQDQVYFDGLNKQKIHSNGAALTMNWELGPATLTSITGYENLNMFSRGDIDGGYGCGFCGLPNGPGFIPFPSESADGIPDLTQWTEELRLASHTGGTFDWLLGAFYFDEDLKAQTTSYDSLSPGNPQNGFATQSQKAKSWALFGSVDYRPNDRWLFKGGLRYTNDKKDFRADRLQGAPGLNIPTIHPLFAHTDANLVTGDLSATYKVNQDVNVYGRIGTGFRAPSIQGRIAFCGDGDAGGTNPATNCLSVAHEEKIKSAEIGLKSELADRKVRLNLATYKYQVDGQQLVAVGGAGNIATLLNADKTDGYGFEADITLLPTSKWLINLGTSYNHTRIDDPNLGVAVCFACTVTDPVVNGFAKIDGNPLPHAPEWIVDGIIDFRQPVGSGLFGASVDWAYHSDKNFFLYESKEFHASSFELGARISYTFAEGRYEVAVFSRNLTNEVIVQNGIDFDNLTGMTNEPRSVGLQFGLHF
jgi:iron complex outermembrane receptor protein